MAASFQSVVQASTQLDLRIPEATAEEGVSEGIIGLSVTPAGTFEIPPEVKTKMTKAQIYELQAVPGYFEPQQVSIPSDQQMLQTNPLPVLAVVTVDEDMREELSRRLGMWPNLCSWQQVYDWAWNIIEGGDDFLETTFGIDIQPTVYCNWETPDNWNYYDLLYAIDDVDPRGVGCDTIALLTAQQDVNVDGLAWCPCPGTPMGGRHLVMDCTVGLPANLFQHEQTHNFGPHDHGWDWGIYCIMSYAYTYWTRGYCDPCTTNINEHRFRYD